MRRFPAAASLTDVWVVPAQGFVPQDLQLHVQPLQFGANFLGGGFLLTFRAETLRRATTRYLTMCLNKS